MSAVSLPVSELSFSFARSSGPGGQNVNKVSTKAVLKWNVFGSRALPAEVRNRFASAYRNRISDEGVITITSDKTRSQETNKEDCIAKLYSLIEAVLTPPKRRIKTKTPRAEKRKRREAKRKNSQLKLLRKRPAGD